MHNYITHFHLSQLSLISNELKLHYYIWLIPLGFIIGIFGTLIGAGGGFILVPVLLLLYPHESPEIITSISLAVVFFNALSGSVAYARMGRIDYKSGLLFSASTIPSAILGTFTTSYMPRRFFDAVFGFLLIVASAFLILRTNRRKKQNEGDFKYHLISDILEADGTQHTFSYNPVHGMGLSLLVGYISSLLGIGGGIIHVPALIHLLNFPVHIATATSHATLAIMASIGTIVHIVTGTFFCGIRRTIFLTVGVFPGAQIGAWLSSRIKGNWIIRSLAIVLGFVGIRVLIMAL